MLFLIDATDGPGMAELRQRVRPEHLDYPAAKAKLSTDGLSPYGLLVVEDERRRRRFSRPTRS